MWDGLPPSSSLEEAQQRKLDGQAQSIGAGPGMRLRDVGCGQGRMTRNLFDKFGVHVCVGLTLSEERAPYLGHLATPGAGAALANWRGLSTRYSFLPKGPRATRGPLRRASAYGKSAWAISG